MPFGVTIARAWGTLLIGLRQRTCIWPGTYRHFVTHDDSTDDCADCAISGGSEETKVLSLESALYIRDVNRSIS